MTPKKINKIKLRLVTLVASYDLRPGNGMGLFWKEWTVKFGSKQVSKKA